MRIWGILMLKQFFEHWPVCKRCVYLCVCFYVKCECARVSACECFLWFICNSFSYSLYVRSMFWKKTRRKNVCNSLQMSRAENANRIIALHCIEARRNCRWLKQHLLCCICFSLALARSLSHSTLDAYVELFALVGWPASRFIFGNRRLWMMCLW